MKEADQAVSTRGIPHITELLDVTESTCITMNPIINKAFTNEVEVGCDTSCAKIIKGLWAGILGMGVM